MSDFDWCAEANRKAALWDEIGAPALALLRELDAWGAVSELKLMEQTGEVDALTESVRALLVRAEGAE